MANELSVNVRVRVVKDNYTFDKSLAKTGDVTNGRGGNPGIVNIGTSEEDVDFGDLTDPGVCILQNLDDTNWVEYGRKDGSGNMQAIGVLRAGGIPHTIELRNGATLRMKADTGACDVLILAQDR